MLLLEKYKYHLITIFLFTIVVILNLKINIKHKLTLLLLALLFCIYEPKFLIPLVTSIVTIYLFNRKLAKTNNNNNNKLEHFVSNNLVNELETLLKQLTDNNIAILKHKTKNKSIRDYIRDKNFKVEEKLYKYLDKTRFLKEIGKCYFFSKEDFILILELNYNYRNFSKLQNTLDFTDITYQKDFNDDKNRNKIEPLLDSSNNSNKALKKLGLLVYKSKFISVKREFLSLITDFGLYSILNNNYQLKKETTEDDTKSDIYQEEVSKLIYEIVIIIFYLTYQKDNQFDFNKVRKIEGLELHPIIKKITDNETDILSLLKEKLNKLYKYYLIDSSKIGNLTNIKNNNYLSKYYYNFKPNITKILQDITGNNEETEENSLLTLINLSTDNDLEQFLDNLFREIVNHIDTIKLMNINTYKITDKLQRNSQEIKVNTNYLILLIISGFFDKIITKIKQNNNVSMKSIYKKKKNIYKIQINDEIKIDQKYKFTSTTDLFYDTFFYYYGLKTNNNTEFKRIFIYPKPEVSPSPSIEEPDITAETNTLSEYQQNNFELELDDYLTVDKVKEKQEDALNKYYQFLDKENYQKLESLNKLAEQRNIELKTKELSFDKTIDNFGKEVFNIIDEITAVLKKFYKNEGLAELQYQLQDSINNPTFEGFASPGASPGPSISDMTTFEKYILFFKVMIDILVRKNRVMYVGFICIIVALFLYFIDSGEPITNVEKPKISSIFDIFKL